MSFRGEQSRQRPHSLGKKTPVKCHTGAEFSLRSLFCSYARFLADADVDGSPHPRARRDVDPRPSRTAVPGGQEYPLVIPEPAESEMASVLEEVTPDYAVTEVAQVAFSDADTMFDAVTIFDAVTFAVCEAVTVFHAITFAVLETIMVLAFIAVVQLAAVALRKPAMVSSVICVGGRRA